MGGGAFLPCHNVIGSASIAPRAESLYPRFQSRSSDPPLSNLDGSSLSFGLKACWSGPDHEQCLVFVPTLRFATLRFAGTQRTERAVPRSA